jgi:hypothetical protein
LGILPADCRPHYSRRLVEIKEMFDDFFLYGGRFQNVLRLSRQEGRGGACSVPSCSHPHIRLSLLRGVLTLTQIQVVALCPVVLFGNQYLRKRIPSPVGAQLLCWRKRCAPSLLSSSAEGGKRKMGNLSGVVQHLKKELGRAQQGVLRFGAALAALGSSHSNGRSTLSAAARKKISLAQKKRWAKARGRAPKRKRTISVAGKKRIAEAQRLRWARLRAQAKKAA